MATFGYVMGMPMKCLEKPDFIEKRYVLEESRKII